MTQWWWVRHGPTHQKCFVGWSDVPADLSDAALIERVDAFLPKDAVILSSDLIRASATADAIAGARERLPHETGLREMNFGDWELKTFSEIAEDHPQLSRDFWSNPGDLAPPNGESWHAAQDRVTAVVKRLTEEYHGRNIIAVAHIGVIMTQIQNAAGMSAAAAMNFSIDNLSVTRIEDFGDGQRVHCVNHRP